MFRFMLLNLHGLDIDCGDAATSLTCGVVVTDCDVTGTCPDDDGGITISPSPTLSSPPAGVVMDAESPSSASSLCEPASHGTPSACSTMARPQPMQTLSSELDESRLT